MDDTTATAWTIEDAQRYGGGILTGSRTRLRGVRESDLEPLIRWRSEPALDILQSSTIDPPAEHQFREFLRSHASGPSSRDRRGFAVETVEEPNRLLGFVTLSGIEAQHRSAEFAIALDPSSGGHGYGVDATRTMVRYGFREVGLHRVWLNVWAYNDRAIRTYRRAGFVEEGRLRDAVFHDGRWHDELVMSALATDQGWSD
ncbi:GNAT family N-acetyltransferase [Pseudolysinimonas sp.]|uniref:GNAT family N-acetyltransferase n=1 Tax=Pseudolysinimonas sp. TaxID=2680009 RepID=UPI003F81E598